MSALTRRLIELAEKAGRDLRILFARVEALEGVEQPKISVGTSPPANPMVGDLWVDTN